MPIKRIRRYVVSYFDRNLPQRGFRSSVSSSGRWVTSSIYQAGDGISATKRDVENELIKPCRNMLRFFVLLGLLILVLYLAALFRSGRENRLSDKPAKPPASSTRSKSRFQKSTRLRSEWSVSAKKPKKTVEKAEKRA